MFTLLSPKTPQPHSIKLTQFSHGSGCGCKIAPAVLDEILAGVQAAPIAENSRLLVGNDTKDDAAIYDIGHGMGLISTVDFFMPIVDDASQYGAIAAANALSDVYAMGGKPTLAVAILGFPTEKLPTHIAQQIISGAKAKCHEAGVLLAGGHTIDSPEPFFGLSVNGTVAIGNIKRNSTAEVGDILYLTKPIGTGILATALKRGLISDEEMKPCIESMAALNSIGTILGGLEIVHAMTDVTGFGLLGHLLEVCEGSNLSAEVEYSAIPLLPLARELTAKMIYADNTMRNWKSCEDKVLGINGESLLILCDPQTSGGLLVSVAAEFETYFLDTLKKYDANATRIGQVTKKQEKAITILYA